MRCDIKSSDCVCVCVCVWMSVCKNGVNKPITAVDSCSVSVYIHLLRSNTEADAFGAERQMSYGPNLTFSQHTKWSPGLLTAHVRRLAFHIGKFGVGRFNKS